MLAPYITALDVREIFDNKGYETYAGAKCEYSSETSPVSNTSGRNIGYVQFLRSSSQLGSTSQRVSIRSMEY